MTSISIIICTHNRCERLSHVLDALINQSFDDSLFEVIIIDNRSTDDTQQLCEEYNGRFTNFIYYYESVLGLSHARNKGVELANSDIVAFLDDDAIPSINWLTSIVSAFHLSPNIICVGGPIIGLWESPRPNWLSDRLAHYYTVCDYGEISHYYKTGSYPYGANMAFLKSSILNVGGFHPLLDRNGENLLSMGEINLFKLIEGNGKLFYSSDMSVLHSVPMDRLNKDWLYRRAEAQGISDLINDLILNKSIFYKLFFIIKKTVFVVLLFSPIESQRILALTELTRGISYFMSFFNIFL